jgi:P-type Ca2+ transporter type 2C
VGTVKVIELPTAPHVLTTDAVMAALDVRPDAGLDSAQTVERLAKFGPNLLPVAPPRSPWRVLLAQFKGIMIVILTGAALLAALVGSYKDALVILAVVVINALVGFYQEYRAERSLDALKSMLPVTARVRRGRTNQVIGADAVVPGDILLDAIALAVAAMPEGLPVVVTVTLALGMHKLARQHAIVKRLASVETLGCTTVICSDKTGTLTLNQMTARSFSYEGMRFDVSGEGYGPQGSITGPAGEADKPDLNALLVPMVACNDSRIDSGRIIGDPMEAALIVLAAKGGVVRDEVEHALPRVAEFPFDSAHKFMATFHRDGDRVQVFVKGAPDVLLARCTSWRTAGSEQPFEAPRRKLIDADYQAFGERGLRGLLIASRTLPAGTFDAAGDLSTWIGELCFVGLVGLMDPPRAQAKQAIAECRQAGIAVKMITGDHQTTATAIASELGLQGRTVSGAELDRMNAKQLAAAVDGVAVFARVTPGYFT